MRATRPRGYILVFVLLILLVLSLVVASLYTQSQQLRSVAAAATYHQVASANADRGVHEAIRALRTGAVSVAGLAGTCAGGDDFRTVCAAGTFVEPGFSPDGGVLIVDNGSVNADGGFLSPTEGGGLQFSYVVFRRENVFGQPMNRFTVRSTGYAGTVRGSANTITAVVEVEIEIGSAGFVCTNAYDCTGA